VALRDCVHNIGLRDATAYITCYMQLTALCHRQNQ